MRLISADISAEIPNGIEKKDTGIGVSAAALPLRDYSWIMPINLCSEYFFLKIHTTPIIKNLDFEQNFTTKFTTEFYNEFYDEIYDEFYDEFYDKSKFLILGVVP